MARKRKTPENRTLIELTDEGGAIGIFEETSTAATRYRQETKQSPTEAYPNLANANLPFNYRGGQSYIDIHEAIELANKIYFNFGLARNVIDSQTDLANRTLYLKGGNKKTRDFIKAWWKKIGLETLKPQWFRELFRSANPFLIRYEGEFDEEARRGLKRIYGGDESVSIPVRYEVLNPYSVTCENNLSLGNPVYYQVVNTHQIQRILNPQTESDKAFVASLNPKDLEELKKRKTEGYIKLDPERLIVCSYQRQDYEPFGVPSIYAAVKDIEAKLELKRIDLSLARTVDRAFLLINVGETPTEHLPPGKNFNSNTVRQLQEVMANEAVARTVICDWTVRAEWLIPDIGKILGEEKYRQLDKDISQALNAIIFDSGEKFANTSVKVHIFLERLKEASKAFIEQFLAPEIKRVCKAINAKNVPEVYFEELSLKDEVQYMKLGLTLAQLGLFTPEELFSYLEQGIIPTPESSEESQQTYKTLREKGLYLPLIGGAGQVQKEQLDIQQQGIDIQQQGVDIEQQSLNLPGRPSGTKSPQSTKRVTPMGASVGFSLTKMQKYLSTANELATKGMKLIKGSKESKTARVKYAIEALMSNEEEKDWADKLSEYVKENKEVCEPILAEIQDIQSKFSVDSYTANVLRLSISELKE